MEKEKSNKKLIIILSAIVGVLLIVGLVLILTKKPTEDKGKEEETKEEEKEKEKETEQPKSNVKIIDIYSKTRPYAIMINCKTEALPQAGLQDAYIVYEETVEGGITRMMALFKDKELAKIGSARSARVQYLPYVFENDAIYVHAGGSKEALDRIANENIDDVDVDGKYGVRDKTLKRAWEHVLFTTTDLLAKGVKDKNIRNTTTTKNLLTYAEEELDLSKYTTKKEANKVSIKYSNYRTSVYNYDKDNKYYLRFMNKQKNTDLVTGEQYHVKNVLVYGVKYNTITLRGAGYQDPQIYGKGEGYYITDGVALPITWEKKDEKSQTVYKIKETGEDLIVNDGNTYIQIYPTNGGKLTIE